MKRTIVILLSAVIALPLLAADGPARRGDDGPNVLVTLTLTDGATERPIQALVLGGQRVRTTTGWRVPFVTKVTETGDESAQVTAIQYQDIGMEVTLHVRIVGAGRVRTSGEVDLGSILQDETTRSIEATSPTVVTFRHVFDTVLADGVDTTLAKVPKPDEGTVTLAIRAEIQD